MGFAAGFRAGSDAVSKGLEERKKRKAADEIKGLDITGLTPLEQAEAKAKVYEGYGLTDRARGYRMDAQTIATSELNRTLAQRQDTRAAETHAPTLEGLQLRNDANRQDYAFNTEANPLRVDAMRQANIGQKMRNNLASLDYDLAEATMPHRVEAARLGNLQTRANIANTETRTEGLGTENDARALALAEAQRQQAEQAALRGAFNRFAALPPEEQTPAALEQITTGAVGPMAAKALRSEWTEGDIKQAIQRSQQITAGLKVAEMEGSLDSFVKWWDGIDSGTFAQVVPNQDGSLSVVEFDQQSGEPVQTVVTAASQAELIAALKGKISEIGPFELAADEVARARAAAKLDAEKTKAGIRRDNAASLKDENSLGAQRIKDEVGVVQSAMEFGDPKFAGQGLELVDEIYTRNRGQAPGALNAEQASFLGKAKELQERAAGGDAKAAELLQKARARAPWLDQHLTGGLR
jgi:hypothetical protein